jgi:hypothetical protein
VTTQVTQAGKHINNSIKLFKDNVSVCSRTKIKRELETQKALQAYNKAGI